MVSEGLPLSGRTSLSYRIPDFPSYLRKKSICSAPGIFLIIATRVRNAIEQVKEPWEPRNNGIAHGPFYIMLIKR